MLAVVVTKNLKSTPFTHAINFGAFQVEVSLWIVLSKAKQWAFYLRGLLYSGLQLSESREVYWDRQNKIHSKKSGPYTVMKIPGELEKGHKDRMLPLALDFVRLLKMIPKKMKKALFSNFHVLMANRASQLLTGYRR